MHFSKGKQPGTLLACRRPPLPQLCMLLPLLLSSMYSQYDSSLKSYSSYREAICMSIAVLNCSGIGITPLPGDGGGGGGGGGGRGRGLLPSRDGRQSCHPCWLPAIFRSRTRLTIQSNWGFGVSACGELQESCFLLALLPAPLSVGQPSSVGGGGVWYGCRVARIEIGAPPPCYGPDVVAACDRIARSGPKTNAVLIVITSSLWLLGELLVCWLAAGCAGRVFPAVWSAEYKNGGNRCSPNNLLVRKLLSLLIYSYCSALWLSVFVVLFCSVCSFVLCLAQLPHAPFYSTCTADVILRLDPRPLSPCYYYHTHTPMSPALRRTSPVAPPRQVRNER